MSLSLASVLSSSSASASSLSTVPAAVPGAGRSVGFASSLSTAVNGLQQQVKQVQAQWQRGGAAEDAAALGDAVNGLTELLAQFSQAMQAGQATASSAQPLAANVAVVPVQPQAVEVAAKDDGTPTGMWVRAALNRAVAQAKANGYDPEASLAVQTLRGYFSGDSQARSLAIRSVDAALLRAGGAYETTEGGVHAIRGGAPEGMDTSMPTFKTPWDKDWSRPSLYDMINSRFGWAGGNAQGVNYANPANRDATLNRKLSDDEIRAFQQGNLSPELQALVQRYRSNAQV